ncbi:UMP-CMP kinase 2, mitochondrial isoform X2 [Tiliqua scincoides]
MLRRWALLRAGTAMAAGQPLASDLRFVAQLASSELVHFALSGEGAPASNGSLRRCFVPPPGRCFSFCVPGAQSLPERIWAARLHSALQSSLGAGSSAVLPLLSYSPRGAAAALERGFLVQDARRLLETERSLQELLRLWLPAPAHLREYEQAAGGELWCDLWSLKGAAQGGKELLGRARVVQAEPPQLHPAVPHLLHQAVFRSLEAAREVLQECTSLIPETKAVLDFVEKCPEHPKKGDFPVIVIEGLDATGKTTVTQSLKDSLNAVLLRSPPSCVNQWRKIFDEEPTLIRRAFYAVTNYIVASEIAQASTKSPVVVDRYWHSTAAYAIATEISGKVEDLPPLHHQVYQWPEDLLRPDMVLMLTVSPEERIRRLQGRGMEKTKEEAELEASCVFRQK